MKAEIYQNRNSDKLKRDKAMQSFVKRQQYDKAVKQLIMKNDHYPQYSNWKPHRQQADKRLYEEIQREILREQKAESTPQKKAPARIQAAP